MARSGSPRRLLTSSFRALRFAGAFFFAAVSTSPCVPSSPYCPPSQVCWRCRISAYANRRRCTSITTAQQKKQLPRLTKRVRRRLSRGRRASRIVGARDASRECDRTIASCASSHRSCRKPCELGTTCHVSKIAVMSLNARLDSIFFEAPSREIARADAFRRLEKKCEQFSVRSVPEPQRSCDARKSRENRSADSQMRTVQYRSARLELRPPRRHCEHQFRRRRGIRRSIASRRPVRTRAEPRGARQMPSFDLRRSFTACGLALPPDDFITWPTNQPSSVRLRPRLRDLVGIGGDDVVDQLLDRADVGDLLHAARLDDRARVAAFLPDDLEQVLGDLAGDGALADQIEDGAELRRRHRRGRRSPGLPC